MSHSVAELQAKNVVFELESIDRMYLNCYVPQLTSAGGVAAYFRHYKGQRFASTKDAVQMTERFRRKILEFAARHDIPIHRFAKGERKDDVMLAKLRNFRGKEGVVFIGIAQEKATVPRTIRRSFGEGKGSIPWIDYTTAMVNFYYFYCVDEDFGPFFLKFCSYFPYGGKLCINGHEYLKRQLLKRDLAFEALDNEAAFAEICLQCPIHGHAGRIVAPIPENRRRLRFVDEVRDDRHGFSLAQDERDIQSGKLRFQRFERVVQPPAASPSERSHALGHVVQHIEG